MEDTVRLRLQYCLGHGFCRSPCPGTQLLPVCKGAVPMEKRPEKKGVLDHAVDSSQTSVWSLRSATCRTPQWRSGSFQNIYADAARDVRWNPCPCWTPHSEAVHLVSQASTARSQTLHHSETSGAGSQVCGYAICMVSSRKYPLRCRPRSLRGHLWWICCWSDDFTHDAYAVAPHRRRFYEEMELPPYPCCHWRKARRH